MTAQGIQKNMTAPVASGLVSQSFDFSDVCPLQGTPDSLALIARNFRIARLWGRR